MAFVPGGGRNQPHKLGGFWPTGQGFGTKGGGGGGAGAAGGGAGAAGGGAVAAVAGAVAAVAGAAGGAGAGGGGGGGQQHICCWICGFPIADRVTGLFPNSGKHTNDPLHGTGTGEHVVDSEQGFGYIGIYQREYGCLSEGSEKEFLKREVRWAHRYCNKVKTFLLVTLVGNVLKPVDGVAEALVDSLIHGGYRVSGNQRRFLNIGHQVSGDDGNNWRNLIYYFIDCLRPVAGGTPSEIFNSKLHQWKQNRILAIYNTLRDYCDEVNEHYKLRPDIAYSDRMRKLSPNAADARTYQQLATTVCPANICENLGDYKNSPSFQDSFFNRSVIGGGGGGGGGAHSSPPRNPVINRLIAEQRAQSSLISGGRAKKGYGGGHLARRRDYVTGPADENEQALALWGYYNGLITEEVLGEDGYNVPLVACGPHGWPRRSAVRPVAVASASSSSSAFNPPQIIRKVDRNSVELARLARNAAGGAGGARVKRPPTAPINQTQAKRSASGATSTTSASGTKRRRKNRRRPTRKRAQ